MKLLALLLLLALPACSTISDLFPSCENKAYAIGSELSAVGVMAHGYTGNPLCGSPNATPICSDIKVVRIIAAAKRTAQTAVVAAEQVCTDNSLQAAQTAFDAYQGIAKIYKAKE